MSRPLRPPAAHPRSPAINRASNGRSVSTARWNRHYLIPTATPSPSATPAASGSLDPSTPVAAFTAPDWVFVTAEKGPTVLPIGSPFKDTSGAPVTPTGRYAYAIYDEGGLLDINHTGYPSVSLSSPTGLTHIGAKPAPSYADLNQLPTPPPPNSVALTPQNVDNLLGWRHYASLQVPATATFPNLQPPGSPVSVDTTYYNLFASNTTLPIANSAPTSLLQVPPVLWKDKTDQRFLSRQQLVGYFAAANLDLRYLQYFGTFSRSLNQPSYLPEHSPTSLDLTNTTDPATRRPVAIQTRGGNDAYGNTGINPNFLTARVITTFKRYDLTDAIVGEPLVKKRFPLNRLAWLTYKGPCVAGPRSPGRDTNATDLNGPDADIAYLKLNGITKEWLDQGTEENILRYFGLQWNGVDKWSYVHGTNGTNGAILNISNPTKSTDVARQTSPAREPDFFELLKGAINPGSIAKTSLSPSIVDPNRLSSTHAPQGQYKLDSSVDTAILQIGANIIDQFDTDGFPTLIHYDILAAGGTVAQLPFLCGDENLPYISRVRAGLLHLAEANPLETDTTAATNVKPILDTGIAALMNYPEIWNLHNWSASDIKKSVGAVVPNKFKIFAQANDRDGFKQATTMYVWHVYNNGNSFHNSCDAKQDLSPGFTSKYSFPFGTPGSNKGGEPRYLSEANTRMTFVLDYKSSPTTAVTLFREPTLLYTPGVPQGSLLATDTLLPSNNGGSNFQDGLGYLINNPTFFGPAGGLKSAVGASQPAYNTIPKKDAPYIGFYIGAEPMRFWWGDPPNTANSSNPGVSGPHYQTQFGPVNDLLYTLACEDGNGGYIPYDVKGMTTNGQPNARLHYAVDSCSGFNGDALDFGTRYYQTIDPRTARFGMFDPYLKDDSNSIPPRRNYSGSLGPSLTTGATLKTDREGVNSGTACYLGLLPGDWFQTVMGWYPGTMKGSKDGFRPGMFSQNNPNILPDPIIASPTLPNSGGEPSVSSAAIFYADADGVVRRASAGNVSASASVPASTPTGLPMAWARGQSSSTAAQQIDSRPSILNRPFRSVAELGYVYSGTPWKNLDFFMPESGNAALLDVFCVNDNSDSNAMTAGQVNLNTHQVPVLQAILALANKDQWNETVLTAPTKILGVGTPSGAQAQQLAQLLVTRTGTGVTTGPNAGQGPQPLQNVSDLVGRWVKPVVVASASNDTFDGNASCDGFTRDLAALPDAGAGADIPMHNIQRFGEGAVRALSNSGQTRVWNLMFDVVAQTGRFPTQATALEQFNVEGEQHYWVHVALDRYTGQVLDKQVEVVKE